KQETEEGEEGKEEREEEEEEDDSHIRHLLRIRTALSFILSAYVPPHIRALVEAQLASPAPSTTTSSTATIDFSPLDARLAHVQRQRSLAAAAAAASDNVSRKRASRGLDEAEDGPSGTAGTKRARAEGEEQAGATLQSRAVRDLKKADTTGMKKISAFFTKK
ncbi:hypothetical protein KEM52_003203, partial [Ascosphaera acerosa]